MDEIAQDVKVAARMLDARKPSWWRRIVFKRLDMRKPCDCIAGQSGLDWETLEDEFEKRHPASFTQPFADEATVPAWQDEVRARRRARA
jgi:hypothetical protein